MELSETVETINKALVNMYGIDTASSNPIFRVVYSNDQREKRFGTWEDYTASGIFVRAVTEVREVPKYIHFKNRYVLERMVAVPEVNKQELVGKQVSYEPLWVFKSNTNMYLPPKLEIAKIVIDSVLAAMHGSKAFKKYIDDTSTEFVSSGTSKEMKENRANKLMEEMFGNETPIGDALSHRSGVGYTGSYPIVNTGPSKDTIQ